MIAHALALTLLSATPAATTHAVGPVNQADQGFQLIHVDQLASMLADSNNPPQIFDANDSDFRSKNGVIPGAKLLPGHDYDVASILPSQKDAKLVFYCANQQCMASHGAASRAAKAGYTNVSVLADGLLGWKGAGKPVSQP